MFNKSQITIQFKEETLQVNEELEVGFNKEVIEWLKQKK